MDTLRAKKRFGQNFLVSQKVLADIASLVPSESLEVWEIGPGKGALTEHLMDRCNTLKAFEVDRDMVKCLSENASLQRSGFSIVEGDALTTLVEQSNIAGHPPCAIVGNLPYNVASPIMTTIWKTPSLQAEKLVFMVQKEVADRLCANEGEGEWGSFSALRSACYSARRCFLVHPGCFVPRPKVTSAVVELTKKPHSYSESWLNSLEKALRAVFAAPRKTVLNSLSLSIPKQRADIILEECGIDPLLRPNKITFDQMCALVAYFA